jgi:hypothetical protein
MAPTAVDTNAVTEAISNLKVGVTQKREPVKATGVLDQYKSFDVTPVIGREFVEGNLAEWLRADNSDDLLRELALTSKPITSLSSLPHLLTITQSLRETLFSSAPKTT